MHQNVGRVVVGVDASEGSHHALAWAAGEVALRGGTLVAAHAWAPPTPVWDMTATPELLDPSPFEEGARQELAAALDELRGTGAAALEVEERIERGTASDVLLDLAVGADLLVVGSRGRGGFAGLLLGSVSHQCLHHAKGPIAVVPPTAPLPGSGDVVVGVDGSDASLAALRWAVDEAALRRARLAVVHGWWVPEPPAGFALATRREMELGERSRRMLQHAVDATLALTDRHPLDVEVLPREEPPATALLERSDGADLLVVGERGRGGFAGLLLGSVSQQCVHHARCAVAVVPAHRHG